jgi:hypothetical protein
MFFSLTAIGNPSLSTEPGAPPQSPAAAQHHTHDEHETEDSDPAKIHRERRYDRTDPEGDEYAGWVRTMA